MPTSRPQMWLPCPCCQTPLAVRYTHDGAGKPYWICDPCGVQLFIRRERGIELIQIRLVGKATQASEFWSRT